MAMSCPSRARQRAWSRGGARQTVTARRVWGEAEPSASREALVFVVLRLRGGRVAGLPPQVEVLAVLLRDGAVATLAPHQHAVAIAAKRAAWCLVSDLAQASAAR